MYNINMKIERISENQVRCTLTSFDLSIRDVNLRELAYGSDKARNLFTEMMQKAESEVGFETEDLPVMIEAIPLKDESVMLVITKVEEPEEVDTRFARFSPQPVVEVQPQLMDTPEEVKEIPGRTFRFENLDKVIEAAGVLNGSYDGHNSLYKDGTTGEYYLLLESKGQDPIVFASTCNVLSEYGIHAMQNYSAKAFLEEHCELIIKDKALEALARI